MTPVELAAQVYQREPCARTFREDLELHLLNGYVFSTPEFFMMGRPVPSTWPHEWIVDPTYIPDASTGEPIDCWHCYLVAGDMRKAFEMVPYPLPWMSFERKNKLRFHKLDVLKRALSA